MKISRKDTIIIAVLTNVALLAILFATASKTDEKAEISRKSRESEAIATTEKKSASKKMKEQEMLAYQEEEKLPVDEIDQVLQEYALKQKVVIAKAAAPETTRDEESSEFVDVTVKKGDALAKIAKVHGVKVEEIMSMNALDSAKLKIGQHLKVPKKEKIALEDVVKKAPVEKLSESPEYYVIKSGDNPWKIAKKFQLKYEDLLILNGL
ncbi:MAG: nlpD, partial [Chlamydiia bacterium]|nr:nlpD [Chlamydiia bacterium]